MLESLGICPHCILEVLQGVKMYAYLLIVSVSCFLSRYFQ